MGSSKEVFEKVVTSDELRVSGVKFGGGMAIWGITLNDWVGILTLVYFVLQIGFLIRREMRGKDEHKK